MTRRLGQETDRRSVLKAMTAVVAAGASWPARGWAQASAPGSEAASVAAARPALSLNVRAYGAVGDGKQDDTEALRTALERCFVLGGGEVVVPEGEYRTGSLCLRSGVHLRLEKGSVLAGADGLDDYAVTQVRWEGKWIRGHVALVYAIDARDVAVSGEGAIHGNAAVSGRPTKENPLRRPALLEFIGCDGVRLEGFSTEYQHMWSIHPTCCENVTIRNLTVRSTETNGDGIDVDSCRHVLIEGCDIASGDDCISLKSGRGEEAFQMHRPTENVRIVNCTLEGRGYSCLGVGSETSGGIRNVVMEGCTVRSVYKNAIYIKSRVGRGAYIENVTIRGLKAANMRMGFLRIDQVSAGIRDQDPVPGLVGLPLFRNFWFEDIHVDDAPVLVRATEIAAEKMLHGLVLRNITGTCREGIQLANARRVVVEQVKVQGYTGPLLSVVNVKGVGLAGAAELPAPKPVQLVADPTVAYRLG